MNENDSFRAGSSEKAPHHRRTCTRRLRLAARETAAEERAAADSLRRHDGILAMSRFPDVLIPGQPAVLQSSAHSESSGIVAPFGSACSGSDGAAAAAAAAAPALDARPLQDAHKKILGLKHLHGLDGAETGNAGDD